MGSGQIRTEQDKRIELDWIGLDMIIFCLMFGTIRIGQMVVVEEV